MYLTTENANSVYDVMKLSPLEYMLTANFIGQLLSTSQKISAVFVLMQKVLNVHREIVGCSFTGSYISKHKGSVEELCLRFITIKSVLSNMLDASHRQILISA